MKLTQNGTVFARILLASAIFSILSITFGFFPFLGLSISLIFLIVLAYSIKTNKTPLTKALAVLLLLLSVSFTIRSEPSVLFLNLIAICYLGSIFLITNTKDDFKDTLAVLFAPLTLVLGSLITPSDYRLEFEKPSSKEARQKSLVNSTLIGVTTIVILAIILLLLASANPLFKKILTDILTIFGLADVKLGEAVFQWIMRAVFFVLLALVIPRIASLTNNKTHRQAANLGLNMAFPKIVVAVVLAVFFVTQLKLYFASANALTNLGYTYSRYTNEVFAQLSAVAAVVLAVLYLETGKTRNNKILSLVLSIEGVFLTFMAFKSDFDYIEAWGLTYKRLYGLFVATWILGIFILYMHKFIKKRARYIFFIQSLFFTGTMLILVNLVNFDYLIYHMRKPSTGQGVDYEYLSRLNPDSLAYKELLMKITYNNTTTPTPQEKQLASDNGLNVLLYKIERLQEKYQSLDIREFNLLEYLQYEQIKEINTVPIRANYKISPTPFRGSL